MRQHHLDKRAKHIVVIDDDPLSLRIWATVLENAGHRVSAAKDGRLGLELIESLLKKGDPIDLLITDIMMPNLSGFELLDALNRMGVDLPAFAITAYGDKEVVVRLLRRGCRDYIEKPVDREDLLFRVRRFFDTADAESPGGGAPWREAWDLRREVSDRREDLERLKTQIDSAVAAYHSLIRTHSDGHRVRVADFNRPLSALGGDFFDILESGTNTDILITDVSGHDMGASYHAILIKALFAENSAAGGNGAAFFRHLNAQLLGGRENQRMITGLFLRLSHDVGVAEVVAAGHPPFIRVPAAGEADPPPRLAGDLLGVFEKVAFETHRFPFSPGDRIFLYTDGLVTAGRVNPEDGKKIFLGEAGLRRLIDRHRRLDLSEMVDRIGREVARFGGYALKDDILLVGIEIPRGTG